MEGFERLLTNCRIFYILLTAKAGLGTDDAGASPVLQR
jgi:hypothetical protein